MLPIKQGQAAIAFVCVVLGFMLAVQFKTTQDIRSTIPFQRVEDLSQRLSQTEKERDSLQDEVKKLKESTNKQEALSKDIENIKNTEIIKNAIY